MDELQNKEISDIIPSPKTLREKNAKLWFYTTGDLLKFGYGLLGKLEVEVPRVQYGYL